jgi:hypothetical protein
MKEDSKGGHFMEISIRVLGMVMIPLSTLL